MAATMEVILESGQAQQGINTLNKGFAKLDLSINRLEKTMQRIEQSINRIVKPIENMAKAINSIAAATGNYNAQITALQNANKDLAKRLDETNNKLRNTAENLSAKAKALNKANKELDKTNKAAEKAGTRFMILNRDLGALNYTLKSMSFSLKTNSYLMTTLAQAAAQFIAQNVVGYLIRMTDQFKLMESRLRIVNNNFATLNTNLRSAVSVAMATRQSLFAIGNLMARVGRNSRELQKDTLALAQATSTISKAFQIAGATAEEARNAIVQLSQALASGRLQGDELRSILELAPTLAESISRSIGITVGQLRAYAREGLITTEVMLAAIDESRAKINKSFEDIKPTVSQAITNVQTSVQALMGFNVSFQKANDALANSFLSLANFIQKFADNKDVIAPFAEALEKLANNIIPLTAGFVEFVKVFGAISLAAYAATKALKIFQVTATLVATIMTTGPAKGLMAFAQLAVVILKVTGLFYALNSAANAFESTEKTVGLVAYNARNLEEALAAAASEITRVNDEARKLETSLLTPAEEATIEWNYLNQAFENNVTAQKEIANEIEVVKKKIKEFSGSARDDYGSVFATVEKSFKAVGVVIMRTVKLVLNSFQAFYKWLKGLGNAIAGGVSFILDKTLGNLPDSVQNFLGINGMFERHSERAFGMMKKNATEAANHVKEAFKQLGKATEEELSFIGRTQITDMMFGESKKDLEGQLSNLKKLQETATINGKKLSDEIQKREVERQKDAKELLLKQQRASTEAAVLQYRLEARLARKAFQEEFNNPFDIKFTPIQSALSKFALSFQKDFQKELQTLVKEASFDLIRNFLE